MSETHLRQRLGIEAEPEARVFGQGLNFFHLENWASAPALIRGALRLAGLHRRGQRNVRAIEIRSNDIRLPRLPPAFEGFTILHLSDPHLDLSHDIPRTLIERLHEVDYDIAVFTGDFRAATSGPYQDALESLEQVRPHLGEAVYAVLGNHDTIRMVPRMEAMGIRVLLNETVVLERGGERVFLAGVDDPHYYRADNLEKAYEPIEHGSVSILMAHSPEIYKHAAHVGFDVMLCGHTHGGQICLPGRIPLIVNARCPRALCAGAWRHHGLTGYTSVGSGACVVDVRLNCPPEITLHRLLPATP